MGTELLAVEAEAEAEGALLKESLELETEATAEAVGGILPWPPWPPPVKTALDRLLLTSLAEGAKLASLDFPEAFSTSEAEGAAPNSKPEMLSELAVELPVPPNWRSRPPN